MTRTFAILALLLATPAMALEPGRYTNLDLRIIDGDTVAVQTDEGEVSVRLLGFDTPETHQPECDEERALGEAATARLAELLDEHRHILTISGATCGFGRLCGRLYVVIDDEAVDAGSILIAEELAMAYEGEQGEWCE